MDELSPAVMNHLMRVYLTLGCAVLASAFGAYLQMIWNIGGFVSTLGFVGCVMWFRSTPSYEKPSKRLSLLFLCTLLNGVSLGLIIEIVTDYDSSIMITSFLGNAVAFLCFSATSMLAKRREDLYLGVLLSSYLSILMLLISISWIFKLKLKLFYGLMFYVGYIMLKTEEIIQNADGGDMDFVQHSFTFLTKFIPVNKKKKELKQLKL